MILRMYKKLFSITLAFLLFFLICLYLFKSPFLFDKIYKFNEHSITEENVQSKFHYGVIIDAGSSGSRLFIYTWPPHNGNSGELLQIKPLMNDKGNPIVKKVNPGLSTLADHPDKATEYIKPLLDLAAQSIPNSKHKETPFYLMATAGMRMISNEAQTAILDNIRRLVKTNYNFLFSDSHAKVITGQEEGIFGWITTNYLLGRFNHNHSDGVPIVPVPYSNSVFRSKQIHHRKRTVGVIDMGGGSMQIAYELDPKSEKDSKSSVTFNLGCRENDVDHTYKVFVTTFLEFGANAVRTRYERMLVHDNIDVFNNVSRHLENKTLESFKMVIEDPCLHVGSDITQLVKVVKDAQGGLNLSSKQIKKATSVKTTFKGTGKYHQCESRLMTLLNKKPCPSQTNKEFTCVMSGRLHPQIDLFNTQFYGFSEFWYSTQDVLGMGGPYNYFKLHSAAVEHCTKDWVSLSIDYKKGLYNHADWPRMRYQCFKSAWLTNVLHNGLGFPNAFSKFISVQEINGAEVQWSLGALLFQTRYFPLRVIEQKELDRKRIAREIRNKPKNLWIYIFLFLAAFAVLSTVYWMHNRSKWNWWMWSNSSYKKDSYKPNSNYDTHSTCELFDTLQLSHSSGPIKDFRSSPNFKHWT